MKPLETNGLLKDSGGRVRRALRAGRGPKFLGILGRILRRSGSAGRSKGLFRQPPIAIAGLIRYLSLYLSFLTHNLKNEMVYRANFVLLVGMDLFFMGVNVAFFAILYANVDTIGGWSFHQTLILIGSVGLIREAAYLLFRQGFLELGDYVRTGQFDALLVKPIPPNIHLGFRHVSLTESLGEAMMGVGLVAYGFAHLTTGWTAIPVYLLLLGVSLVTYYGFCLLINSAVFWIVKSQELNSIVYTFMETARYPREIYRGLGKAVFTFVIPISLIATVPASVLAGRLEWELIGLGLGMAIGMMSLAMAVWNMSLRHYSSASS